jgi:hypothetical protein
LKFEKKKYLQEILFEGGGKIQLNCDRLTGTARHFHGPEDNDEDEKVVVDEVSVYWTHSDFIKLYITR